MTDGTQQTTPAPDAPAGYYPLNAPDHLVDTTGSWRLGLKDDGTVELRHNGNHVAYLYRP